MGTVIDQPRYIGRNADYYRMYGENVPTAPSRQVVPWTPIEVNLHRELKLERELQERIQSTLEASRYLAVRGVHCRLENGVLALHGTLPSYYYVQLAISIVQKVVCGDVQIQPFLKVEYPAARRAMQP